MVGKESSGSSSDAASSLPPAVHPSLPPLPGAPLPSRAFLPENRARLESPAEPVPAHVTQLNTVHELEDYGDRFFPQFLARELREREQWHHDTEPVFPDKEMSTFTAVTPSGVSYVIKCIFLMPYRSIDSEHGYRILESTRTTINTPPTLCITNSSFSTDAALLLHDSGYQLISRQGLQRWLYGAPLSDVMDQDLNH